MKEIDIPCESQVATIDINLAKDAGSSSSSSLSSSSTNHLSGGRAIDRHNPIITDSRRISKTIPLCSAQPTSVSPKPQKLHQKNSSKVKDGTKNKRSKRQIDDEKRKSVAEPSDGIIIKKSWGCINLGDFISPPASARYLLSDPTSLLDVVSDFDPVLKLVPPEPSKSAALKIEESCSSKQSSSSRSSDQVVVLRVSLHCKGCERKMRKHISRMEGVTSFNIDFAAKKVTVVGDVTPLGVLASVSKVKNAQLWTPAISSSFPLDCSEVKKQKGVNR